MKYETAMLAFKSQSATFHELRRGMRKIDISKISRTDNVIKSIYTYILHFFYVFYSVHVVGVDIRMCIVYGYE